jgi:hypothetical protein
MKTTVQLSPPLRLPDRTALPAIAMCLLLIAGLLPSAFGQNGVNPLNLFQNYFVTGDYVVAGWVAGAPDSSGYAPGTISIPDTLQPSQERVPATVPKGADIVAAYLYWATVESSQSSFAGQQAFFNRYAITGTVLGNPNAPTSWSAGGCSGSSNGSKTMRTYRADVHPYLPLDKDPSSSTFGATVANGTIPVRLADSGSNGNKTPFALGATLVIIYRVLSPRVPLNAIVLYDGAFAPSNAGRTTSQTLAGFYEPATSPVAKITHIVANGQPNKREQVYLNNTLQPLASLYPSLPPFPGVYGSWDNPTWVLSDLGYVNTGDVAETTLVVPSATNSGCVSWGAVILSTTVQDSDGDGLLDVWERNQGYIDPVNGQWVALPEANPNQRDIFVELDYLVLYDSHGNILHSHLPKQAALDAVGTAFANQKINVHFDLGPGIYQGDPYVISYLPNAPPMGAVQPPAGTGGNAISESQFLCTDEATLCAYPGQLTVGWKGGLDFVKNSLTLGNFQPGRQKSYHYMLFAHSLGAPRSYWSTVGAILADPTIPQLVSVVNAGSTATITLQSPQGVINPGDCLNAGPSGCGDASINQRVTITGALGQTTLNGSYLFSSVKSTTSTVNNISITTTTFNVPTSSVADGTYNFSNEPQLAVTYLGPTSTSGHSDFRGGGDSMVTLGLWGADDAPGCETDPSQPLGSGQNYCSDQVGTVNEQTGTLMHELGHTLTLTHGGTYYDSMNNPSVPMDELNCKPNYLSVMNYLFQVRGFADGGFDLSGQSLPPLNEALLNESVGLGADTVTSQSAAHLTRWYSMPNALDTQLQNKTGGRYATAHCDGTPLLPKEMPAVRVDGSVAAGGTFSGPLDWNNNFVTPDMVMPPGEDLNHNGFFGDPVFSGFNDWDSVNLQQIGARAGTFGSSGGINFRGGGINFRGGGIDNDGGGINFRGGGINFRGGGINFRGGGIDQDEDTAASTADAPIGLTCVVAISGVPGCVASSGTFKESGKKVPLTWSSPGFGQVRSYTIWRAVGSFPTTQAVLSNFGAFSVLATLNGAPPATSFIDSNVKNNTYTYFVTDANKQGAHSGESAPIVVSVK